MAPASRSRGRRALLTGVVCRATTVKVGWIRHWGLLAVGGWLKWIGVPGGMSVSKKKHGSVGMSRSKRMNLSIRVSLSLPCGGLNTTV